jgi:acetyl esterase/lipase
MRIFLMTLLVILNLSVSATDTAKVSFVKKEIVYGRKDGMALTMTMLAPKQNGNGKAIISTLSGNWVSSERMIEIFPSRSMEYVKAGYTVFGVMVSSQPRYTIPDEVADLKRAVRFIRYNANDYNIDPAKIGITGSSSGGHLSLMVATANDTVYTKSADPVDKVSSRVQAVAVFYPPTDFINFGGPNATGTINQQALVITGVAGAFDFKKFSDSTKTYLTITDTKQRLAIAAQVSPINAVTPDDPPVLIIHGDKDMLVPKQQSESIIAKFKEANVTAHLIIKEGGGHGWPNREAEEKNFVDWFDKYLK